MAKIVGAKERLGEFLWGRYLCDSLGVTRAFAARMDLFSFDMGGDHTNFEGSGCLPCDHQFRILHGAVFCRARDPSVRGRFATDAHFVVEVNGCPRLTLDGAGQGWSRLSLDGLALLRGEESVLVGARMGFKFLVNSKQDLVEVVHAVEESTDPDRHIELLGCLLGLKLRDIL